MPVCLTNTETIRGILKVAKANQFRVEGSIKKGGIKIFDPGDTKIYQALKKNGNVWIVNYENSEYVIWASEC